MAKVIDTTIESAKGGQLVRAPVVNLKVRKNGKRAKQMDVVRATALPEVGDQVVRIINECDPIGFLSDIVNGKAIQCHVVNEEGTIHTFYETPGLNKRIEVAKFLAERYLPKVAVTKHAHLHKTVDENKGQQDDRTNFDQMVTHAANASTSED